MNALAEELGFTRLEEDEAAYITEHVLHCGSVDAGDWWPWAPGHGQDVLPGSSVEQRLYALLLAHQLVLRLRHRDDGLIDYLTQQLRTIFAEACCGEGAYLEPEL